MTAAQLSAWFAAHKMAVLGGGGAAVVGLALYRKRKGQTSASNAVGYPVSTPPGSTTGYAPYDSSATDVYDALQPQIEGLSGQLSQLFNQITANPSTPAPGTTSPAPGGPTNPPPLPPTSGRTGAWLSTGKFGLPAGHPLDYAYLQGAGYITRVGNQWLFTGRGGTPKNHPVDYGYMSGIGFATNTSAPRPPQIQRSMPLPRPAPLPRPR